MDDEPLEFNVKKSPQKQVMPNKEHKPYLADVKEENEKDTMFSGDYYTREYAIKYPLLLIIAMIVAGLSIFWRASVSSVALTDVEREKAIHIRLDKNKVAFDNLRKLGIEIPDELFKPPPLSPQEIQLIQAIENQKKNLIEMQKKNQEKK